MSVWYCIPSARPPEEAEACLSKWRDHGYKIALFVDWNPPGAPLDTRISRGDIMLMGGGRFAPKFDPQTKIPYAPGTKTHPPNFNEYPGYAQATNALIAEVLARDPSCDWCVAGGDDIDPDANHTADEIAAQCSEHFARIHTQNRGDWAAEDYRRLATWGVMQPTGDRFDGGSIDRICGSPWLGREFCRRVNQGRGPFWPEYTHMFSDEELQNVAVKLGVLWQRPDLIHYHNHFQRVPGTDFGQRATTPPHLAEAYSPEHWRKYKALFEARKATGFPGSEVIG